MCQPAQQIVACGIQLRGPSTWLRVLVLPSHTFAPGQVEGWLSCRNPGRQPGQMGVGGLSVECGSSSCRGLRRLPPFVRLSLVSGCSQGCRHNSHPSPLPERRVARTRSFLAQSPRPCPIIRRSGAMLETASRVSGGTRASVGNRIESAEISASSRSWRMQPTPRGRCGSRAVEPRLAGSSRAPDRDPS
nr:hypothetical protein Hi04_10k_c4246_00007 [uncultured bacterium]